MPDLRIRVALKDGQELNFEFDPCSFFTSLGVLKPMLDFIKCDVLSIGVDGRVAYADDAPDWRGQFIHAMLR